jgi:hypothetical protein
MKNITTEHCLKELEKVDLSYGEKGQLEALVRYFGYLGAIEYLKPPKVLFNGGESRNQAMADKHRTILENVKTWWE